MSGRPAGPGAVEAKLAAWASELEWDAVRPAVQARVRDILLDALASALAGRSQDLLARAERPARAFAGPGTATVIGSQPAAPAAAVLLNAYAITAATVCDVYRPGLCHVTPVVLPPLLALAEERESSGRELLAAFAVGLEVTVRLSRALDYDSMRGRGWHSPGVVGPVGAAAAAARLLALGAPRVSSALGHAAAQAAGTFAALGTEAVKFNQARGAVSGLLAALVAEADLEASPRWLTHGDGGMAGTYSERAEPSLAVRGLGRRWELEGISLRRWPAASSVQSLIDGCLSLRAAYGLAPAGVGRVEVELGPSAYQVSGEVGWSDSLGAQQSARWVVAAVLHDGDWWLEQSAPARTRDETVSSFARERVTVRSASDLGQAGMRLRVELADGRILAAAADHAPGDPSRPLDRAQIEQKLRRSAPSGGIAADADELLERFATLESLRSVAPLVRSLRAGAGR